MARPLSEIPDQAGPIGDFARRLRELRVQAGNPTLSTIAEQCHLSKSVISEALSGRRLPSEQSLQLLVRTLGGTDHDAEHWCQLRREVLHQIEQGTPTAPDRQDAVESSTTRPAGYLPTKGVLLAGCVALLLVVAVGAIGFTLGRTAGMASHPRATATAASGVAKTGDDPVEAGCVSDAKVVGAEKSTDETLLVELMYSPTCKANWARITRYDGRAAGNTATAILSGDFPNAPQPQTATARNQQSVMTNIMVVGTRDTVCATGEVTVDGRRVELGKKACG